MLSVASEFSCPASHAVPAESASPLLPHDTEIVFGVLVEVPVMLSVVKIVNATQPWYEQGAR